MMNATKDRRLGISMPIINQPFTMLPEMAALADEAGFDSVWDYEFYRNPFTIHSHCARTTSNITLATGLATTAGRSPFEMANAAADVDELSGGRALIGLSTGAAGFADCLHGADVSRPVPKLREYIQCMRMGWEWLETEQAQHFEGDFYRFNSPPFNPWGGRKLARSAIPIYIGGLKPAMLRLAGAMADGVLGYLISAKYARENWVPHVLEGAKKAGREASELDIASLVICSVDEDREAALRLARINVGIYAAYPVSEPLAEYEGLAEDRNAVVQTLMTEGPAALAHTTSDALVKAFSITGTPDEAREQLEDYKAVFPHLILHTPYVPPIAGVDSERAFRNSVKFLGPR